VTDAFGTGMLVNRCILQIYSGGTLYNRIEKSANNEMVTFDTLRLVTQNAYDRYWSVLWYEQLQNKRGNFHLLFCNCSFPDFSIY
jgi:hypothetical protein